MNTGRTFTTYHSVVTGALIALALTFILIGYPRFTTFESEATHKSEFVQHLPQVAGPNLGGGGSGGGCC